MKKLTRTTKYHLADIGNIVGGLSVGVSAARLVAVWDVSSTKAIVVRFTILALGLVISMGCILYRSNIRQQWRNHLSDHS